jgi:hypothetical protein
MSRKDYVAIAAAISATKEDYTEILGALPALKTATKRIAEAFASDNPRFDRDRFMDAAGFPEA